MSWISCGLPWYADPYAGLSAEDCRPRKGSGDIKPVLGSVVGCKGEGVLWDLLDPGDQETLVERLPALCLGDVQHELERISALPTPQHHPPPALATHVQRPDAAILTHDATLMMGSALFPASSAACPPTQDQSPLVQSF